jgi:DNA repair exonuclease SbcCD ATPase subunit
VLAEGRSRWSGDPAERARILDSESRRLTVALDEATKRRRAVEDAAHRLARNVTDLDAIERERDALVTAGDPAAELDAARVRCAQLQTAIDKLDSKLAKDTAQQEVVGEQRRALAARAAAELAGDDPALRTQLAAAEATMQKLDATLAAVATERKVVEERQRAIRDRAPADLVADAPALRVRRDEREAMVRQIDDALAAAATERKGLEESTQFLMAHAPGAGVEPVCPVCRRPLPEALRQRLLAENATRDAALAQQIAALRAQREGEVAAGHAEAEELQQRLLAESAAQASALAEQEMTLRRDRRAAEDTLETEVQAVRERLLAEHDERARALAERLTSLRAERQARQVELEEAEQRECEALGRRRRLDDLVERRRALLPADATIAGLRTELDRLAGEEATAREQETRLVQEADGVRQELAALHGYLQLAAMEGHTPAGLAAARAGVARRELLADLFASATAETLARLREGALVEAYSEVERAWEEFSDWADARLEAQPKGGLVVRRAARRLELGQLSGGERAAFLVLLHAHLGRHFGRGGFILLDEPLEHLDADNGRRLLQHLVRACREGLLSQVVMATVEADVVHSAVHAGEAHVVDLPQRTSISV